MIYKPKGKAREYSPLALNIYNQCDHNCRYCYVPMIQKRFGNGTRQIQPRQDILSKLNKEAYKYSYGQQVLLCFMCDPYCRADIEYQTTRDVLEILLENNVSVAILTKGGKRCLRDINLFREFKSIKVGASLTFLKKEDSLSWEKNASLPSERIETLRRLKEKDVKTWVSLEPVIDPEQTLEIIDETYQYVDQYKVGKLNYVQSKTDWKEFGLRAIDKLNKYDKRFYIKNDLAQYIPRDKMIKEQRDMDYLALKGRRQYEQLELIKQ